MYILREHDELLTQSDICGITYESKQTVNSALKKMEINGFIELIKNEDNMKKKFIYLTEKGLELAEKTADKILAAEENSIRAMGRDEMETLLRMYEKYIDILDKEMNDIE
ncbi:MAG: winged helix DNA-binding protein [Firmicutes bacterium]|nr:winged helix DNA-binding protein [Bacillota bacterium]